MITIMKGITLGYLGIVSIQDIRKKEITPVLLVCGGILAVLSLLITGQVRVIERITGVLLGALLLGISFLTKEAMGKADCIFVMYLGLVLGFIPCAMVLLGALFLCSVCCIFLLSFRRINRKQRVPFMPFILIGFVWSQYILV